MSNNVHNTGLAVLKVGAIAFALAALCYFVLTAHGKANPPSSEPDGAVVTPIEIQADAQTEADPIYLPSSKVLVLQPSQAVDGSYLYSSKSFVIPEGALNAATGTATETIPEIPSYLFSSKSAVIEK